MSHRFESWAAGGFAPYMVPVKPRQKAPAVSGWTTTTYTEQDLEQWALVDYNIGLKTERFPAFDIDIEEPALAARVAEIVQTNLGQTHRRGRPGTGKLVLVYRLEAGTNPIRPRQFEFEKGRSIIAVDLLGKGNQFVAQGIHPSGDAYFWTPRSPAVSDLPTVTPLDVEITVSEIESLLAGLGWQRRGKSTTVKGAGAAPAPSILGKHARDPKVLADALDHLPNPELAYDQWIRVGMAIKGALGDTHEAFELFNKWSAKSSKFDATETWNRWDSFDPRGDIGAGTVFAMARAAGWQPPAAYAASLRADPKSEFTAVDPSAYAGAGLGASTATGSGPRQPRELPFVWNGHFAGPPPPRKWLVNEWMPDLNVTSIYGMGGAGKSYLAQQLVTCVSRGMDWLGLGVSQRRCAVFSCEDDVHEYWVRQAGIDALYGLTTPTTAQDFLFFDRLGLETLLMTFTGDNAAGTPTWVYEDLRHTLRARDVGLIVVDTAARTFGGNENARAQVQHFVQAGLVRLARDIGGACVLLAHPSKSVTSGGYSGSTAWPAAVRSMLTLGEYDPAMPDMRSLKKAKANYSGRDELVLKWSVGGWVVSGTGGGGDKAGAEARFLSMLDASAGKQVALSTSKHSDKYAPVWFRKNLGSMMDAYRIEDITAAMERLLSRGAILAEGDLGWQRSRGKPARGICRATPVTATPDLENPF